MNPQTDSSKLVSPDSPDKTKMVQPPHMHDTRMGEEAPKRYKVKIVKQLAAHNQHPGDLPPVTEGMTRIFTTRGVNDGFQSYSEYNILDVEPAFAKQCCEDVFQGQFTHTGECLEKNQKKHELMRAVYMEEFMAQFVRSHAAKRS